MDLDIRVVELLVSRLCHDLVSPVGAIRNGLELIEEMNEDEADGGEPNPAFLGEALKLIDHSSRQADCRLRAFRLAYGVAGREPRDFADVRAAIQGWVAGGRTAVDWADGVPSDPAAQRPGVARTLLNTLMLADEALTRGGSVGVTGEGDARSGRLAVTARGRPGALTAEVAAALAGEGAVETLTARTVHAYLTGRFAAASGLRLTVAPAGPETLVFTLEW